jgi:uncharacterized FlaG/YvyC family protein
MGVRRKVNCKLTECVMLHTLIGFTNKILILLLTITIQIYTNKNSAYFRKLILSKEEHLQKVVADSFEPQLAKYVQKGKHQVNLRVSEMQNKMLKLKHTLQNEYTTQLGIVIITVYEVDN